MLNRSSACLLLTGYVVLGLGIDLSGAVAPASAQGQVHTNAVPFDLQGFIDKEIQTGRKRLVVPPRKYRVVPRDRQHLLRCGD